MRVFNFFGFTFRHLFLFIVASSRPTTSFSILGNFLICNSLQADFKSREENLRWVTLFISIKVFTPLCRPFNLTPNDAENWQYFAPNKKVSKSRDSDSALGKIDSIFTVKTLSSAVHTFVSIWMHLCIPPLIFSARSARTSSSEASFWSWGIFSLPSNPLRQAKWKRF